MSVTVSHLLSMLYGVIAATVSLSQYALRRSHCE